MSLSSKNILASSAFSAQVSLDPATNMLMSFRMLNRAEELPGLGEWIVHTAQKMSAEQHNRNQLVFEYFLDVIKPLRTWSSFEDYLADLEATDATVLRDKALGFLFPFEGKQTTSRPNAVDQDLLSMNFPSFKKYIQSLYPNKSIDPQHLQRFYRLLKKPNSLKETIISHLDDLWNRWGASEWRRILPKLKTSLKLFEKIDFSRIRSAEEFILWMFNKHSIDHVQGDFDRTELSQTRQLYVIPSMHLGIWSEWFYSNGVMRLVFNGECRLERKQKEAPSLSHSEVLVRLTTMGDDTRLRILKLLTQHKKLSAQEILTLLELSQSSASRHLIHLSATGFLIEWRKEREKWYSLNRDRIDQTLQALEQFLQAG